MRSALIIARTRVCIGGEEDETSRDDDDSDDAEGLLGHKSIHIHLTGGEGKPTVWVLRPLCTSARFLLYNWILTKQNKSNQIKSAGVHLPHLEG